MNLDYICINCIYISLYLVIFHVIVLRYVIYVFVCLINCCNNDSMRQSLLVEMNKVKIYRILCEFCEC